MTRTQLNIVRSCTAHLDTHPAWTIYPDYTGPRRWAVVMPNGTRRMFRTRRAAEDFVIARNDPANEFAQAQAAQEAAMDALMEALVEGAK